MSAKRQLRPEDGCKRRDTRRSVLIRATMRAGGRPVDVCIRDVSVRGVCVVTAAPPPRGTVIELTGLPVPIVGQVVWSSHRRFGVEVGGRIDLPRLLSHRLNGATPHEPVADKRAAAPAVCSADDSRHLGRAMQFAITAVAGAIAALGLAQVAYQSLASAADQVAVGLTGRR